MIRLNPKNIFGLLIASFFIYLVYLLWTKDDPVLDLHVDMADVVGYAVMAVEMGGQAIKKVHEGPLNIRVKGGTDVGKKELLTQADLISNHLIMDLLKRFPLIKVVSEEKAELSEAEVDKYRDDNYNLWLNVRNALRKIPNRKYDLNRLGIWVDPLDATQEFTEGLLEYVTVMACVTLDGQPIFGAINRPFQNQAVFGYVGFGLMDSDGAKLSVANEENTTKTVVVSRSHAGTVQEAVKKAFGDEFTVEPAGGAGYKTLRVLNGTAADALIRAAGGKLLDLEGQQLDYSNPEEVLNKKGLILSVHNPYELLSKFNKGVKN